MAAGQSPASLSADGVNFMFFYDFRVNTDKEYNVAARYMIAKSFSISTNYDSDYKWGIGLTWHY